ncbi:hypothetical protein, variant [Capsaspora owczarzaki ATCC 30864]|uniref:Peptidase C39-like domain-containing protein n=1 Tax=Capsaspora owczarzaki (strain ATCC 30864) TaxID=595528 RepID=A0A0D2VVY5_CAPO3|nr:hypothetical protein, variant [Capsaspora owczarzaki ATCC 30864]KJE95642.1 hypothetical protein CAOG_006071 [Capsaspora owczarzaki ATCC 30864]|eukprot:XP_011270587.1 hypothetical protein, variant [Capsaspora owczarzaki ATCC 30864]
MFFGVFQQLEAGPPSPYPLFKQCDPAWGDDLIDTETICQVGCLMSSISMAIHGWQIKINGTSSNPQSLNNFLRANNGYIGDDLDESAVPKINPVDISWPADGMHPTNDLSFGTIASYLEMGRVVIANVLHGRHFVLVTAASNNNDTLFVNDPGFNTTYYSYSADVVGWRLFDML